MNRRRALMMQNGEVSPLPAGYKQLKFLESSGHQYLDIQASLGPVPPPSPVAILDVELTAIDLNQCIFGFTFVDGNRRFQLGAFEPGDKTAIVAVNSNTIYAAPQYPNDTQRHLVTMTNDVDANNKFAPKLIVDGVAAVGFYNSLTFNSAWAKSALFATSYYKSWAGTIQPNMYAYMKCYQAQFYMGIELLRDFLPALRKSDGVPGMYDFVSEALFVNEGTGQFGYEDMDGSYTAPI